MRGEEKIVKGRGADGAVDDRALRRQRRAATMNTQIKGEIPRLCRREEVQQSADPSSFSRTDGTFPLPPAGASSAEPGNSRVRCRLSADTMSSSGM